MKKRANIEQSAVTRQQMERTSLLARLAAARRRSAALKARCDAAIACAKALENWHDERR